MNESPCDKCGYPIKTRWTVLVGLRSDEADYAIRLCALCWHQFIDDIDARRLHRFMNNFPVPRPLPGFPLR